jgi:hypothetical protein
MRSGWKASSADADEEDWPAGHVPHRQRGAPAGVAVGLREHDAGEVERGTERPRRIHGVLARHAVHDEERLDRLQRRGELADLVHHLFVDVQPARGVDEQHVVHAPARLLERTRRDVDRAARRVGRRDVDPELLAESLELQHGRRAVHVGRDEEHALALAPGEPQRDLRGRRRLARAL